MTARSEFRLMLRQDNAERRLAEIGRTAGLIDDKRYSEYLYRKREIEDEIERCRRTTLPPSDAVNAVLTGAGSSPITTGAKIAELIRRPQIEYDTLAPVDEGRPELPYSARLSVQTEIKYEGYVRRQLDDAKRFAKLEEKRIPDDVDYEAIGGLRTEAVQKLSKIRPSSIGQASRISGVSPADISVLMIYLTVKRRAKAENNTDNINVSDGEGVPGADGKDNKNDKQ